VTAVRVLPTDFPPEGYGLVTLSPSGTRLAVSCEDADHVLVFDPHTGRQVARAEEFRGVYRLCFLSDQELLVTHRDGCHRWNVGPGGPRPPAPAPEGWQASAALDPDGRLLAVGGSADLFLCDPRTEQVVRRLAPIYACGGYGPQCPPAFSARGRYVAADFHGSDRGPDFVAVWEVGTGRRQRVIDGHASALAFRDDTLALAVSNSDRGLLLYEPDRGEEPAARFEVEDCAFAVQFRDGGRTLAALMAGGGFVEFDATTGAVVRRAPPPAEMAPAASEYVLRVAVSADWTRFAGVVEAKAVVWPGDRAERGATPDSARM
jgi:hypothetical protein